MRQELIGYLLGALDQHETIQVETRLRHDAQLRRDLEMLKCSLRVLNSEPLRDPDPPKNLAATVCCYVDQMGHACTTGDPPSAESTLQQTRRSARSRVTMSSVAEVGGGSSGSWSLADAIVVAGVCATAALLFAPVLFVGRNQAQQNICQYNLQQVGLGLIGYANHFDQQLPFVPATGPRAAAGIYAPTLLDARMVTDPTVFACPTRRDLVAGTQEVSRDMIPELSQVDNATDKQWKLWRFSMGGDFAYVLGYINADGKYVGRRIDDGARLVLLGDSMVSANGQGPRGVHGRGVNFLYGDGHVKNVHLDCLGPDCDDVFHSDRGLIEAGRGIWDIVLAPSQAAPLGASR